MSDQLKEFKRDEPFVPTQTIGIIIGVEDYAAVRNDPSGNFSEIENKKSTDYYIQNMQKFFNELQLEEIIVEKDPTFDKLNRLLLNELGYNARKAARDPDRKLFMWIYIQGHGF